MHYHARHKRICHLSKSYFLFKNKKKLYKQKVSNMAIAFYCWFDFDLHTESLFKSQTSWSIGVVSLVCI